jgi:class 3 adenylate cyclase/tetratricopeptide (TPR) repeat protein
MSPTLEEQIKQLQETIQAMEAQRDSLGDAVVDAGLAPFQEKLDQLLALLEARKEPVLEAPAQQRKLVTLLFMDVVGSTGAIAAHLDPEDTLEIMDKALKRLADPVEKHGGHVTRFMGDGFKAVFGAPVAREDDPEQAVRTGLDILETASEIAGELEKQWDIQGFQVRVGINTGLVALGGLTEDADTVMGKAVNLGARMESAAPPGGLLISVATYWHVRGIFNLHPAEPVQAKGFDEPVQVYLVESVKPRVFRVQRRGVEGVETHMVGRDVELLALQEAYRNAVEGIQTHVVTVVGEAGVGKTRLLFEFQDWLDLLPDEVRLFQGQGRQESQNIPYALLKDVFSFRFEIHESDRTSQVHDKVEAGFGVVFGLDDKGVMRAHITGQLLGFDFSHSTHLKGILDDPQQIHDRGLMYLAEYFQGMCDHAPVVVFLEDIHWSDDSSLDMLNRLVRRIPDQRLSFICLARHRLFERRPHWGEGLASHRRLDLRPLTRHHSTQLVGEILQKIDQVPDTLQELVVNGAEGNPFYIEELIKMLVMDGVIITDEENWRVEPHRLAEIQVPDTLTGVLQARLEGLPQVERSTLQQASIIGHTFWDDTIEYMDRSYESTLEQSRIHSTDDNLSSLRARELIYHLEESAFADTAEYTFKHAVLRDVTYESVLKRLRKTYHSLVAEWLIKKSDERVGEYTGLIADHLELAGKMEQAAIYLYQAGEEAARRFANDEAVEYFTRALALIPEDDLIGRYDLLLVREKVFDINGDRESQGVDLETLEIIAESLEDTEKQALVILRRIKLLAFTGNYSLIPELAENAIELAIKEGNLGLQANIYLHWGRGYWRLDRIKEAQYYVEKALEIAREHHLLQVEADSLRSLGAVATWMNDFQRTKSYTEQSLERYRQLGDKRGEAAALNNLAIVEIDHDLQSAINYFQQALDIYLVIGDRQGEGLVYGNLGGMALGQSDFNLASEWISKSLAIRVEVNDRFGEYDSVNDFGWLYFYTGEYEKSTANFKRAMEICNQLELFDHELALRAKLSRLYSTIGDLPRADLYHQDLYKDGYVFDRQASEVVANINYAWFAYNLGEIETAREHSQRCDQIMGDDRDQWHEWERLLLLGHAAISFGDLDQAEEFYQGALALDFQMYRQPREIETQAGLARVSLVRGNLEVSLTYVEDILTYMQENSTNKGPTHCLDGTEEPFRIYLTCYQVLKANHDSRARTVLMDAYNMLQERASNFKEEELRDCFLTNVAVNREILIEYEKCS